MKKFIALVDCNNFFVSCERTLRPDLAKTPVVVLSSNDGCVISRSNEAKKLGIQMGIPWFRIRNAPYCRDVAVFSSNIAFYAEVSREIKKIMSRFTPVQEEYSIDESFLDLTGFDDIRERAYAVKDAIFKETGIPVCVGIAPTKTLAKLANMVAKKHPRSTGVLAWHLLTDVQKERLLSRIAVEDVWGVGRRLSRALDDMGIRTAVQLRDANRPAMQEKFGVVMDRMIAELRGISCFDVSDVQTPRKQILSSRSFGRAITGLSDLENAAVYHVTHIAREMREEGTVAGAVQVFIGTDHFRKDKPQYHPEITVPFKEPTSSTLEINRYAMEGLRAIYRSGYEYHRSGISAVNLVPASQIMPDLFADDREDRLMKAMDDINRRFGADTLRIAQNDPENRNWSPKKEWLSAGKAASSAGGTAETADVGGNTEK